MNSPAWVLAAPLRGERIALEPFRDDHGEELWAAAQAPEIWSWLAHLNDRERFEQWLALNREAVAAGREGIFVVRLRKDGRVVGSTRFMALRPQDRALEIGWTWFHPSVWGSGVNAETKLLLLEHAFERLGCVRVELKTDARNERSRAAIAALPAQFEGVLRKHMIVPDVGQRDTAYFSVLDEEWPAVRANLERRLSRY